MVGERYDVKVLCISSEARSSPRWRQGGSEAVDPCADHSIVYSTHSVIQVQISTSSPCLFLQSAIAYSSVFLSQILSFRKEVMAPARTKKVQTSPGTSPTARPQTVTLQSPTMTPLQSPQKKSVMITEGQKQALIDNLQLESEHF